MLLLGNRTPAPVPGSSETDRAVLARIAEGSPEALAVLYDRHITVVWRLAHLMSATDPEAVVVAVFEQVWKDACRAPPDQSVSLWLVTVTRRIVTADRARLTER